MAEKTNLVQMTINSPSDALQYFNADTNSGQSIPIVLVPASRVCCSCCFTIPTGSNTIVETCGEDANPEGLADAGLHFGPYWKRVAYMVSPQAITYNAPVKKCPTKDNVMVDCDLSLVIHIGNPAQPRMVKDFVYKLGARRFNEYLSAAADEGIRQLVRDTALDDVYELRGSGGQAGPETLLKSLQETFDEFGIVFKRAAITDVHIGTKLVKILQGTTEFQAKIEEAEKEHKQNMQLITYDHDQELKQKDRDYDRRIQDAQNDQQVALVDREKQTVDAEARRGIRVTQANEAAAVLLKRSQAELTVATATAQEETERLLAGIQAKAAKDKIAANQEAKVRVTDAEAEMQAAKDKAAAILAEADAEGKAASSLVAVREHKLNMARYEVSENIAKNSKVVISGETGEKFIASMVDFDSSIRV